MWPLKLELNLLDMNLRTKVDYLRWLDWLSWLGWTRLDGLAWLTGMIGWTGDTKKDLDLE